MFLNGREDFGGYDSEVFGEGELDINSNEIGLTVFDPRELTS